MSWSGVLSEIERLCRGEALVAAEMLAIGGDLPARRLPYVHPETLVGRRRDITERLGSGAHKLIRVEHYNDGMGIEILGNSAPVIGSLAVNITAKRSYTFPEGHHSHQFTSICLQLSQDKIHDVKLDGSVPFDPGMVIETEKAWQDFGLTLIYHDGPTGGLYSCGLQPDHVNKMISTLKSYT